MTFVTFKEILELIDKVADKGLGVFEIESAGMKLRIEAKKEEARTYVPVESGMTLPSYTQHQMSFAAPQTAPAATAPAEEESDPTWHIVTSPIVGTFYRAPNPESDAFVNVGDHVSKGKVLCIVEAMKLMNEIEADADGVIVKIYPQNGQPIEYGEKLFALKA
ncbi:MAG: acetyl-CoA carboxylase biotin carboxyl carrier protein [Thermoanaerobaculia bacterium]